MMRPPVGERTTRRSATARWSVTAAGPVLLGVLAAMLWSPASVQAAVTPGGSGGSSGYMAKVSVRIHFSGEASPYGDNYHDEEVTPTCYWGPADGPYQDAAAMLAWYDLVTGGQDTRGEHSDYGPRSVWEAAAEVEKNGGDISWYRATCQNPDDYNKFGVPSVENQDGQNGNQANFETYLYYPFAAGQAIPPPLVSPEELALAARRVMRIDPPVTQRNPTIHSLDESTLVGLPTWFWTAPRAVGGADGATEITATLDRPGGAVSATVVATTNHMTISWPGGTSVNCDPAEAMRAYASNLTDAGACTVQFPKASTGLNITAHTHWEAVWNGSDGTGGGLPALNRDAQSVVPVAEVQNVVTR
jgi:hypothetical protein